MTTTLAERVRASLPDAALAALATLSPQSLTPAPVHEGALPTDPLLPGPGSVALVARLAGRVEGSLVLLLAEAVAEQADDAAAALESVLGHLDTGGLAVDAVDASVLAGESALAALDQDGVFMAAPLLDEAGTHVATLCVVLDADTAALAVDIAEHPEERVPEKDWQPRTLHAVPGASLDLLQDVEMAVSVELGRTRMTVRNLLGLAPGAVVELDRAAGSPVDMLVNGRLIARGEVVVVDEEFAVRITEIVGAEQTPRRATA